jgi:hypothetical protein
VKTTGSETTVRSCLLKNASGQGNVGVKHSVLGFQNGWSTSLYYYYSVRRPPVRDWNSSARQMSITAIHKGSLPIAAMMQRTKATRMTNVR